MPTLVARRYDTLRPIALEIEGERITRIFPGQDDPGLPIVAPGLVDLQINGYGGVEFNDRELTVEKVRQVAHSQDAFGVTSFLATCTTDSHEVLHHALKTIARAIRELPGVAARIPGIHLEGPFISPDDGPRGAHPKQHVRPPDWDEFSRLQDAAEGRIKLLTISPEYDIAVDVIRRAAKSGVLIAIGHTQATSDQIQAAVDAGARMSTHLGNGAHPTIRRRHPTCIAFHRRKQRARRLVADDDDKVSHRWNGNRNAESSGCQQRRAKRPLAARLPSARSAACRV